VNSLPKTVIRQRRGCDLNPGPSAPESSTLTTQLPSHPVCLYKLHIVNVISPPALREAHARSARVLLIFHF